MIINEGRDKKTKARSCYMSGYTTADQLVDRISVLESVLPDLVNIDEDVVRYSIVQEIINELQAEKENAIAYEKWCDDEEMIHGDSPRMRS
jgi:bacterioferritin (cytochrome b1)